MQFTKFAVVPLHMPVKKHDKRYDATYLMDYETHKLIKAVTLKFHLIFSNQCLVE